MYCNAVEMKSIHGIAVIHKIWYRVPIHKSMRNSLGLCISNQIFFAEVYMI